MATRLCASFCLDEEVGLYEVDRQIAAANSIPEGAPVGTIARRPDGEWLAERKVSQSTGAGRWCYLKLGYPSTEAPLKADAADSWPVIYDPTDHPSREELREYFHKDLAEHCQVDDPDEYPDEYHEGDKPRLERLMREPSVFDADPHGTVNLDGTLPTFTPDPTAQQEPALRERFPEQASAYVADPELAEVDDEPLPSGSLITPKPRTPRVVDRLGVDEQGSRWRNRCGEVHEFRDGCWKYKDGRRWFPSSLSFPEYTEIVGPRVLPSLECEEARDGTIWEYTKDGVAHRVQFLGERWVCLSCDLALIGSELTAWSPYTEVLS